MFTIKITVSSRSTEGASMDKKKLLEMGLTEEQATKVLSALKEGYVDKPTFDQKKTEADNLSTQLKDRDKQIESLKKFEGDNEALKTKIQEMEETNKTKASEFDNTLLLEIKKNAVRLDLL